MIGLGRKAQAVWQTGIATSPHFRGTSSLISTLFLRCAEQLFHISLLQPFSQFDTFNLFLKYLSWHTSCFYSDSSQQCEKTLWFWCIGYYFKLVLNVNLIRIVTTWIPPRGPFPLHSGNIDLAEESGFYEKRRAACGSRCLTQLLALRVYVSPTLLRESSLRAAGNISP